MTLPPPSNPAPSVSVSVIICAYTMDRWDLTLKAIASVSRQSFPATELVVVIDHNRVLFDRLRSHDPELRVIENQQRKGLSGGRNTGIACTSGDIVGFLDDDAEAADDWLAAMVPHFARPEVIGVGSRLDPVWIGQPRAWFPAEFLWVVGCTYLGLPETAAPIRNVSGGGMLIHRRVFDQVGDFSHQLGRTTTTLPMSCEETELCIRAQQGLPGSLFMFEPRAVVGHHVSAGRLTWRYLRLRCYAEGLSKAMMSSLVGAGSLSSERRQTLVVLPRGVLRGLADTFFRFDPAGVARAAAIILGFSSAAVGYLVGRLTLQKPVAVEAERELGAGA